MKKLLLILLSVPILVNAQRIEKNYIDKFTKTQHIKTTEETLVNTYGTTILSVWGSINVSKDSLKVNSITFFFKSSTTSSLTEGSKLYVLFDDGTSSQIPYEGSYQLFSANNYGYFPVYLNDDELSLWGTKVITDIRIDNFAEYSIKKKHQNKIPNICNLLFSIIKNNSK